MPRDVRTNRRSPKCRRSLFSAMLALACAMRQPLGGPRHALRPVDLDEYVQPVDVELGHRSTISKRYSVYCNRRLYAIVGQADTGGSVTTADGDADEPRFAEPFLSSSPAAASAASPRRWRWRARAFAVKVLEQAAELGEIGAGIQLGPNAFAAFDALGIGEQARGRAVYTDEMVMHDALDETLVGRIPTGEAFRAALRQPLRGDPSRRRAPLAARRRAGQPTASRSLTSTQVQRVEQDDDGVTVHDAQGPRASRHRADRRRRREVGGAPPVRRRRGARVGPRRLPRGGRAQGLPGRPAMERGQHLGRPQLPPGALPAARRRAVQRGRHLPQPRAGRVERARRQPRRGAELLRRHLRRARAS